MEKNSSQNVKAGFALGLTILGIFIPVIGLILIIIGLFLAHSVRKTNKDSGVALASMIIGYIGLVLALIVTLIVVIVGYQTWYATYQSGLNNQVEQQSQTHSTIDVEKLEQEGNIYLKNSYNYQINNISVSIKQSNCSEKSGVALESSSVEKISLSNCDLKEEQIYDVIIRTNHNLYTISKYAR